MKKILKRCLVGLFILISAAFLYFHSDLIFQDPFQTVQLDSVVKAAQDQNGNVYVLDSSGGTLQKINNHNKILYTLNLESQGYGTGKDILVYEDSVYVHTTFTDDSGYRISGNKLCQFSVNGTYVKTIYSNTYDQSVLVTDIEGMYIINSEFAYLVKSENSFAIYNENNEISAEYKLENTEKNINSIAVSSDGEDIYYCNLNGTIYKYIDGENDKLIYNADEEEGLSIPRSIILNSKNELYFTDIGRRQIYYLQGYRKAEPVGEYEEGTSLKEMDICYNINADYGLVANSEYTVKVYGDNGIRYIYELVQSLKNVVICIINLIIVILYAILAVWIFRWIFKNGILKLSRIGKMGLLAVGLVGIIALIFTGIILPPFRDMLLNQMFNQAQVLSESAVNAMPVENLADLTKASDYDSESYKELKESMDALFLNGADSTCDFYCSIYTIQEGDIITNTFCLQEDTGAIYPYDWAYEGSDEQEILTTLEGKTYSGVSSSEGNYLFVLNPIIDGEGKAVGLIEVGTDIGKFQTAYNSLLWNMIINMLAITVVIILVIIEVLVYMGGMEKYHKLRQAEEKMVLPNGILRLLVFMIFFVTNLSTGFLPNYAMTISSGYFILPKEILAAIPISAEVVAGAVFSIWGNSVIRKLGGRRAAIFSSIGIVIGFLVRLIPNVWILIFGNVIVGAGWGILLLMVNTIIALKEDEDEKDSGFADYSAAALNGINCGVVFGGLLTNWMNYRIIFIVTALFSLAIFVYCRKYFSGNIFGQMQGEEEQGTGGQNVSFPQFILNGKILSYFIMIVIPVIACGYFLNYMFPILGAQCGLSDTNIGYSYLLNGVCVICVSPILTKVFSVRVRKDISLVISVILYAVAFVIVARYQNIYSILAALVLLGISDSFGLPVQTGYYTDLDIVKSYGYDKAMGIYSLFENGAQAAGSFIFGGVLIFGVGAGLNMMAGIIVMLALIFLLTGIVNRGKTKVRETDR